MRPVRAACPTKTLSRKNGRRRWVAAGMAIGASSAAIGIEGAPEVAVERHGHSTGSGPPPDRG